MVRNEGATGSPGLDTVFGICMKAVIVNDHGRSGQVEALVKVEARMMVDGRADALEWAG